MSPTVRKSHDTTSDTFEPSKPSRKHHSRNGKIVSKISVDPAEEIWIFSLPPAEKPTAVLRCVWRERLPSTRSSLSCRPGPALPIIRLDRSTREAPSLADGGGHGRHVGRSFDHTVTAAV